MAMECVLLNIIFVAVLSLIISCKSGDKDTPVRMLDEYVVTNLWTLESLAIVNSLSLHLHLYHPVTKQKYHLESTKDAEKWFC